VDVGQGHHCEGTQHRPRADRRDGFPGGRLFGRADQQHLHAGVHDIDKFNSRPDFAIAFYPGHICRSGTRLDPGLHVTSRTPPTFLLQAWDDPLNRICNSTISARALNEASVPSEVHLFATGGHSFGLKPAELRVVEFWPPLVDSWLKEIGVVRP